MTPSSMPLISLAPAFCPASAKVAPPTRRGSWPLVSVRPPLILVLRQQHVEEGVAAVQEVSGDLEVVGVLVGDLFQAAGRRLVDQGVRIAEDDWRVGGDDELR